MNIRLVVLLALGCVLPSQAVLAQKKMYRCGSIYQDRPCEAAAAPAAPAAKAAPPAAAVSGESAAAKKADFQRQVRCENYGRQMEELRSRQKGMARQGDMLDAQIKALEGRMKGDSC